MAQDILKNSIWYTILGFLPLSFAVVFTPIYLNYMNESEYGLLNLFMLYSGILSQIYNLGVNQTFIFLYWDVYKNTIELKKFIANTLGLLLSLQLFFISIGFLFGEGVFNLLIKSNNEFSFYPFVQISLFFSAFMVFYELFQYLFRNQGNLKLFSILSVGTLVVLTIGTLLGVVWFDLKALGAIIGRTVGYGSVVIIFLIYLIWKYGVSFDFRRYKSILIFALPLFANAIVGTFSYGTDKILIERLDTLSNLGIYGFALVVISVIEIWFKSINNALSPTLYKFISESLDTKTKEIQGITHFIIFSVILVIVMAIALVYPMMNLLIPENFHKAGQFVPVLAIGVLWRVFTTMETFSIYKEKKTNYLLFNQSSLLIATLVLGYIGYRSLGIIGLVYGVYFARVIEYLVMVMISKKVIQLNLKLNRFIVFTILITAAIIANNYLINLGYNKQLLYFTPLLFTLLLGPILFKNELNNVIYCFKNRKQLLQ